MTQDELIEKQRKKIDEAQKRDLQLMERRRVSGVIILAFAFVVFLGWLVYQGWVDIKTAPFRY